MFPAKHDIGISYCRMLLCDTILKDDSYKTGTSSPICDCGEKKETLEHFLAWCSNYAEAKKAMFDFDGTEAFCLFSYHTFHSNVNKHLLQGCKATFD